MQLYYKDAWSHQGTGILKARVSREFFNLEFFLHDPPCDHSVFRIRIRMDPVFFADPDPDFKTRIRPFFPLIYCTVYKNQLKLVLIFNLCLIFLPLY